MRGRRFLGERLRLAEPMKRLGWRNRCDRSRYKKKSTAGRAVRVEHPEVSVKFLSKGTCFDRNLRVCAGGTGFGGFVALCVYSGGTGLAFLPHGCSGTAAFFPFFAESCLKNRPDTAILLFSNGFYFFINDNETGSDYGEL